jgi:hypothetical protein
MRPVVWLESARNRTLSPAKEIVALISHHAQLSAIEKAIINARCPALNIIIDVEPSLEARQIRRAAFGAQAVMH